MKIYNTNMTDVLLDVINKNGQFILLLINQFEEQINSYSLDYYEECYLIVEAIKKGFLEYLMMNASLPLYKQVEDLMAYDDFEENEALFVISVLNKVITNTKWMIEILNINDMEKEAIEEENIEELRLVAKAYFEGFGVKQDYLKAFQLYTLLSEFNDHESYYYLGYMSKHGLGTEQSSEESLKYFSQGATYGLKRCLYELGKYYYQDHKDISLSYFEESDYYKSYYYLGLYEYQLHHIEEALYYFKKGAKKYDKQCLYMLGLIYGTHDSLKDDELCLKYTVYAYYLDHKEAMKDLSRYYIQGRYVEKDVERGLHIVKKVIEPKESIEKDIDQRQVA